MGLSVRHLRTLRALGDTLHPSISADDVSGGEILPSALDEFLRALDADQQKQFRILLTLFELGAVVLHARPFSRLSPEQRERYVDDWMRSRLAFRRIVFRALMTTASLLYYSDARTWKFLRYAGPEVKR